MTDLQAAVMADAMYYLRDHACDCGQITCVGDSIADLVKRMATVLELHHQNPPGASTLVIEKKPDQWVYVAALGPMTSSMYAHPTAEAAHEAAQSEIERRGWPKRYRI